MDTYCTYLRVSTQKQGRSQLGLTSQRNMCNDFIESRGGFLGKEFVDVESGTHRDRKGLWGAIDYCKNNQCPLVIATLSRLARDVEFCFKVINTGIEIHFVDMPQINTLLLGVFASVAQYERELTSERTKKALAVKKKQGAQLGAANLKYKETFNLKTEQEKQEIFMKRGELKRARYQERNDFQQFKRIIKAVFPDHTTDDDIMKWEWLGINTKGRNGEKMLEKIRDYRGIDPTLFRNFDGTEQDWKRLRARLYAFKRSLGLCK